MPDTDSTRADPPATDTPAPQIANLTPPPTAATTVTTTSSLTASMPPPKTPTERARSPLSSGGLSVDSATSFVRPRSSLDAGSGTGGGSNAPSSDASSTFSLPSPKDPGVPTPESMAPPASPNNPLSRSSPLSPIAGRKAPPPLAKTPSATLSPTFAAQSGNLRSGSASGSPLPSPKSPLSPMYFPPKGIQAGAGAGGSESEGQNKRLTSEYHRKMSLGLPGSPGLVQRRNSLEVPSGDLLRNFQLQRRNSLEVPLDRRLSMERRPSEEDFKIERRMSIEEALSLHNSPVRRLSSASQSDMDDVRTSIPVPLSRRDSMASVASSERRDSNLNFLAITTEGGSESPVGGIKRTWSSLDTVTEEGPASKRPRSPMSAHSEDGRGPREQSPRPCTTPARVTVNVEVEVEGGGNSSHSDQPLNFRPAPSLTDDLEDDKYNFQGIKGMSDDCIREEDLGGGLEAQSPAAADQSTT